MELITLRAGDLSLDLAPHYGGCIAAFRLETAHGFIDLLRPLPEGAAHALHSGMFPMVPFANCIRDNIFSFEGNTYYVIANMPDSPLNFHGSGWQLPWVASEVSEGRVVLLLDDATVDDVYRFDAAQEFILDESGLAVDLTVTNRCLHRLPFSFGQHPWFPRHGATHLRFSAAGFWTESTNGVVGVLTGIPVNRDYETWRQPPTTRENNCYTGWNGTAEIGWPEIGIGLSIEADPVFSHLMLYVPPNGEPVFCVEPQSNAPCGFDGLEIGQVQAGVVILEPAGSIAGTVRFAPIPAAKFQVLWGRQ